MIATVGLSLGAIKRRAISAMHANHQPNMRPLMHRVSTLSVIAVVILLSPFAAWGHDIPEDEICVTIPELDGDPRYRDEVAGLAFSFVPPKAETFDDASEFQCYRDEVINGLYDEITRLRALLENPSQVGDPSIFIEGGEAAYCASIAGLGLPIPSGCAKYGY